MEVDAVARTIRFYRNDKDLGIAFTDLPVGSILRASATVYRKNDKVELCGKAVPASGFAERAVTASSIRSATTASSIRGKSCGSEVSLLRLEGCLVGR